MRILGIDPGFERVGVAILEKEGGKETLLYSDCFKTSASLPFPERLALIGAEIARVINTYHPDILAIETLLFSKNQKTAMQVAEARGVVLYEAAKNNLELCEYNPLQIKVAVTGYGKADKKQVNMMVEKLITIKKEIKYDDEIDAIAVGLTCATSHRA